MAGWIYGISTFVGYLTPNPLLYKRTFYLNKFSLARVYSLFKTFLFQAIQFSQTVLIQTIQFSVSIFFIHTQLNVKKIPFQTIQFSVITISMSKTVIFQTIQFCISTQFSSIWPIDMTLSGSITLGHSELGSNGIEGVFRISQSSSITGTSPPDCLVSYPGHSLNWGGAYPFAEVQSVYPTAPADWFNI